MKNKLTPGQTEVLAVLKEYGPIADHALVPLAQHQMKVNQSSSGIRSRRAELQRRGLVVEVARTKTRSGRMAGVFEAA